MQLRHAICLAVVLTSVGFAQKGNDPSPDGPGACPLGATTLCAPLDATYSVVSFSADGPQGNGPASAADPCQRNDDDFVGPIPLGFAFDFYGTLFTEVFINNNGNVSFGAGFSTFTSSGFPVNAFPMIAPFWGDVDTRAAASGVVYFKAQPGRFTVIWDHVGYYNIQSDKLNTFELILTDGLDPLVGIGNNVCFCYDDMQWTTGSASGGVGGFGGTPATVGANKGDGTNFFQIGRFDHAGNDYDGPGGNNDGVSYLDNRSICFTTATTFNNLPPIATTVPAGNTVNVNAGACVTYTVSFIAPEVQQSTSLVVNDNGLQNFSCTIQNGGPGQAATATCTFCPTLVQCGPHTVSYTATDNGSPPQSTTVNVTLQVGNCTPPAFIAPTPCGGQLMASVGVPFSVTVTASDVDPASTVTLTSGALPTGATLTPALPSTGNPVSTTLNWTPTNAQSGNHVFVFTAIDNTGLSTTCSFTVAVAECYLLVSPNSAFIPLGTGDTLYIDFLQAAWFPVTLESVPTLGVPSNPALYGVDYFSQVVMYNPLVFPNDAVKVSNGLHFRLGVGTVNAYGTATGMTHWCNTPPMLGANVTSHFNIWGL